MEKYRILRDELVLEGIISSEKLFAADLISKELLILGHDEQYVDDVLNLKLDHSSARKVGLPLTQEMVNRARTSANAFTKAVDASLEDGFSASLAGGTHHAHFNEGEGFCFFNDFAINARRLGLLYPTKKILILDLDVHQGNGNSSILKNDLNTYIVSFHGEKNYPFRKIESHIDISFSEGAQDQEYLTQLEGKLTQLKAKCFDHIFYQAGVDTLKGDRFGSLHLTHDGLMQRDRLVFDFAINQDIPITVAMGGGYHRDITQTVIAYKNIFKVAKSVLG